MSENGNGQPEMLYRLEVAVSLTDKEIDLLRTFLDANDVPSDGGPSELLNKVLVRVLELADEDERQGE